MREFHAVDEIVVGEAAVGIILDWVNGSGGQSIPLLNCSRNEVEPLPESDVIHRKPALRPRKGSRGVDEVGLSYVSYSIKYAWNTFLVTFATARTITAR